MELASIESSNLLPLFTANFRGSKKIKKQLTRCKRLSRVRKATRGSLFDLARSLRITKSRKEFTHGEHTYCDIDIVNRVEPFLKKKRVEPFVRRTHTSQWRRCRPSIENKQTNKSFAQIKSPFLPSIQKSARFTVHTSRSRAQFNGLESVMVARSNRLAMFDFALLLA
jgi:hypothetical protein